jgi:polysaccharide export outer membrane protein
VPMLQGRMSLTEALTFTGGLNGLSASDSGILVFRRSNPQDADPRPVVYTVDMSHPEGLLLAGEFILHPRDVVYVQATGFAKYNLVVNQLLPTISSIFQIERFTKDISP